MGAESTVEYTVVGLAEKDGWFCRKIVWPGHSGAPDHVFIKGGRVVWIEFKAPGKEARILQKRKHGEMRAHGAEVHVVDSVPKGLAILGIDPPARYRLAKA